MTQDDRIAFSLKIVSADAEAASLDAAKASLQAEIEKSQKLDTANKNLFDPPNALSNRYQLELQKLDGIVRTTITESDILDAGAKKVQNHFFPNDLSVTVPSLSGSHNVWTKVKPFALTYANGKNYTEGYPGSTTKEGDLINSILSLISSSSSYMNIELTSGQHCSATTGSCSLPLYVTQSTCEAATPTPGVWTPGPDAITTFPAVQTLKTNMVSAVNTLISFIDAEIASIVNDDPDAANQTMNNAAVNDLTNVIRPTLVAWLALTDFVAVPGGIATCIAFYAYNPSLLGPTKLHSTELTQLQTALNTRASYVSTRTGQLNGPILGVVNQDLDTGETTGSGIYLKRYNFLTLRLNALGGSLTQLQGLQVASGAQTSIKANILATKAIYQSIVPTSMLKANASGNETINLVDPSFLSVGDTVYVYANNQEELKRAVKSITGGLVVLNDIVPAKYRTVDKARLYKDLT